jgi:transposase-like protein
VRDNSHVNGIEGFWSTAQVAASEAQRVSAQTFSLHLKECEYRFNHRHENLYRALLKLLKNNPL